MPPKVKIQNPPKFCAGPHEDVIDWIDRYETIGAYNGWDDTALRKFFIIYLDGPARHWYQCKHSTFPQIWASTPEVRAGNVVQVQAVKGTRELFLEEFQKGNNKLFMERKLRSRMQGEDESPLAYYYDIMNMFRILDPTMDENTKLDHLYQGLKRSIFTSDHFIQKPETCESFFKINKAARRSRRYDSKE